MSKSGVILSAIHAVCIAAVVLPSAQTEGPVAFEHVNLVRVQDGTTRRDVTLVIADGRVSPADNAPPHARRIDAGGAYVIPGLWDMHVRVNEDASWMLPLAAAMGVVGMRETDNSSEFWG
jgi:adenine deaminase